MLYTSYRSCQPKMKSKTKMDTLEIIHAKRNIDQPRAL